MLLIEVKDFPLLAALIFTNRNRHNRGFQGGKTCEKSGEFLLQICFLMI